MRANEPVTKTPNRGGWVSKFVLFVVSLAIFLEIAARLFLSVNPVRRRILGSDSSSYRLLWIGLHRLHLERTGPYGVYDPRRGWKVKPDIKSMSLWEGKTLNSNSKGLRGKTEYAYQRTAGKHRILTLGDSFTFGEGVSDNETYSHYLESALPNTEVVNLGVPGYGHDQMLLYLKEEGVKYHPDVVILGFTYLNIYRNLWNFFVYAKPEFKLASGRLELTNVPVPTPDHVLALEPYRPKALDLMVIVREKLWWSLGITDREARGLASLIFDQIVATTRGVGAVPVFVYAAVLDEIDDPSNSMTTREQFLDHYCHEQGIPCLFLRPRFREEIKRGTKLKTVAHWDAREHQIAAQEIKDFLLDKNLAHF